MTLTEAGAAVVLRVDDARVGPTAEALVRAAVPPGAAVEVRLEPIVLPPPWSPPAGAPSVALSALVAALTLACGALLVQLRRVRRSRA
ncbi:MAG: hypothetical protein H6706_26885 [Myxococcales bacterium]|nr:hypothetical protein [Myxococcales bacterium]